jgi:hypothetical protein
LLQKSAISAVRLVRLVLQRLPIIRSLEERYRSLGGLITDYAGHGATAGGGRAISFARRRRFCAIAASVNSSCAPHGPRNRSRPSLKMRLRWANTISTRLRLRRDCSKASILASARATSRASS